jgi:2-iminoacetate synthase ThiH
VYKQNAVDRRLYWLSYFEIIQNIKNVHEMGFKNIHLGVSFLENL